MARKTTRVWIIQRCTQQWIGTDLKYEDVTSRQNILTRGEMLRALDRIGRRNPNDEFRGHNTSWDTAR
jgi:hypothetical protein